MMMRLLTEKNGITIIQELETSNTKTITQQFNSRNFLVSKTFLQATVFVFLNMLTTFVKVNDFTHNKSGDVFKFLAVHS